MRSDLAQDRRSGAVGAFASLARTPQLGGARHLPLVARRRPRLPGARCAFSKVLGLCLPRRRVGLGDDQEELHPDSAVRGV